MSKLVTWKKALVKWWANPTPNTDIRTFEPPFDRAADEVRKQKATDYWQEQYTKRKNV